MQAARRKGNTMRDTRTRRGVERAARKATSTARASRALDGLLDLVALPVREAANCTQCRPDIRVGAWRATRSRE